MSNIYVTQDQAVKAGDKILDLSNGETLKAGIDGTVNEIAVAKGDWLRRSQGLVQIVDFTQLQVDLSVDEYDVQKVYKGLPCTVTIISLGLDIETEIDHINLVSGSMGNVASYSATARLDAPENVLPGMAAHGDHCPMRRPWALPPWKWRPCPSTRMARPMCSSARRTAAIRSVRWKPG